MGNIGYTLGLEPIAGKARGTRKEVREALLDALDLTFETNLPAKVHENVRKWFRYGLDSLLTIDHWDEPEDEPVTDITFWFNHSCDWAYTLAEHWLCVALRRKKQRFQNVLRGVGYEANGKWFSDVEQDEKRFIVDGERIGYFHEDGVRWEYPRSKGEALEDLSPEVRARAEAVRDGAPCECPWCQPTSK